MTPQLLTKAATYFTRKTQVIKQSSEALAAVRVVEVSFQDNVKHNKRKKVGAVHHKEKANKWRGALRFH